MKKINFAALLPGFLALNNSVWANDSATEIGNISNMSLSEHDLILAPLNTGVPFYIAGHRSHSSSHRSSSGGGYSTPYYPKAVITPAPSTSSGTSSSVRSFSSNNEASTTRSATVTGSNSGMGALTADKEKRRRLIMRVQFALFDKGYYDGVIDGVMGPSTRSALSSYRIDYHLPASETLDSQLLNSLGILAR
ncbi:His-Xaa-Ser repeat protein HxsA [Serratia sp. ASV30]|uniref:His-Xaa-Ser repeat protein HxsA n=1 Tax=Serratia sp. ASV30 TaxID=2795127 RepID=UPI0018EDA969|nr:His-Xaa-Ser repeat protein HxsA [Serratia sp. ASV30]